MSELSEIKGEVYDLRVKVDQLVREQAAANEGLVEPVEIQRGGEGQPFEVAGTPALGKQPVLSAWRKVDAGSDWEQIPMEELYTDDEFTGLAYTQFANNERLWTSFVDGPDAYPWYGLRLTYDYVRAIPAALVVG